MALTSRRVCATTIGVMLFCTLLVVIGKVSWNRPTRSQPPLPAQHEQELRLLLALQQLRSCANSSGDSTTGVAMAPFNCSAARGGSGVAVAAGNGSSRSLTIVTAFMNIGPFPKGTLSNIRGPDLYRDWMRAFSQIHNAVVAYFDDPDMAASFASIRAGLPTRIVMVSQRDGTLWSYSLKGRVQAVLDQPGYPRRPPQTTNAAYVCAMHAKFEFMEAAASANHFGTRHLAWMDLGLFREHAGKDSPPYVLQVPLCYRDGAVAFSQVYDLVPASVKTIMRDSVDWVSGAFFIADVDTMLAFARDYRHYAEALLDRQLASHDQSVIMAMYSPQAPAEGLPAPVVPLQAFQPDAFDPWFYIPYVQRQEWLQRNSTTPLRSPVACSSKIFT